MALRWEEKAAAKLSMGVLPERLEDWPPRPRYAVQALENSGMSRDAAVDLERKNIFDWWERTHKIKES